MAARFPASASMQRMANNPQQAPMFQRSQFQQSPYGMAVSFWFIDCLNSLLGHLKLCQLSTHEGYFLSTITSVKQSFTDLFLYTQKSSVDLIKLSKWNSTNHLISQLEFPVSASKINSTIKPATKNRRFLSQSKQVLTLKPQSRLLRKLRPPKIKT